MTEFSKMWKPWPKTCICGREVGRPGKCECGREYELYQDDFGFRHFIEKIEEKTDEESMHAG